MPCRLSNASFLFSTPTLTLLQYQQSHLTSPRMHLVCLWSIIALLGLEIARAVDYFPPPTLSVNESRNECAFLSPSHLSPEEDFGSYLTLTVRALLSGWVGCRCGERQASSRLRTSRRSRTPGLTPSSPLESHTDTVGGPLRPSLSQVGLLINSVICGG